MSISAVGRVSQVNQKTDEPPATTPAPPVTPFSQQLDAEGAQAGSAHAHHHHHHGGGGALQSAATAASAAGIAPSGAVASSILNVLS